MNLETAEPISLPGFRSCGAKQKYQITRNPIKTRNNAHRLEIDDELDAGFNPYNNLDLMVSGKPVYR